MIITTIKDGVSEDYEVESLQGGFKSPNFPPPALGRKYFLENGSEIDVKELGMKVEDNRAMYYYSYRIAG
jgi:hypothetical protein